MPVDHLHLLDLGLLIHLQGFYENVGGVELMWKVHGMVMGLDLA